MGRCQALVDREAALRQLTWALHLILAEETASVNSRRDRVISSCEDEHASPPLVLVQERITLHTYCAYTLNLTHRKTCAFKPSQMHNLCKKTYRGKSLAPATAWLKCSPLLPETFGSSHLLRPFYHLFNAAPLNKRLSQIFYCYIIMGNLLSILRGLESNPQNELQQIGNYFKSSE